VQVKNKCERLLPLRPPGVEKTSRLRSRDPVASKVKYGPHGGKNNKTKSWTVSWLSLKTKVEPGLRGSRVMSGDWRRLHRVRGVSSGSPVLTVKFRQPSHEFTFGVGMTFVSYPLVLTTLV
jgi:hypothetical protein